MMKRLTTILFLIGVFTANGFAQSDNQLARFTILIPKEGMQRQFEDGYKRHLRWHVDTGETWNWYGWFVASGTRLGYFIDATFGHSWSDFDKPINPAADRADLEVNVFPFVTILTQFTCVHLTSYSAGKNSDLSTTLTQVIYFKVKPGQEQTFEEFLAAFRSTYPKIAPGQNFSWYRVEDGDKTPQYFLFVPHKNQAERQKSDNFWVRLWQENAEARIRFENSVAELTTETMRYRADLTFVPSKSATK